MINTAYTPGALSVDIDAHLFVIFGGTGDLARSKLLPAVYRLLRQRDFADNVQVLAVATRDISDTEYQDMAAKALEGEGPEAVEWAKRCLSYQSLRHGFEVLRARIEEIEARADLTGNRAFYLAIPPRVVGETVEDLGKYGLVEGGGWARLVVEKPFGTDGRSSDELNHILHAWFDESQIYRIDHYLAKETVQNLMALRFANPLFESSWNRDRIDSIQITIAEDIGIGSRAGYYDRAGAIRDIIQNHALQILSLVAMEPPVMATADHIRDEKVKVLKAIRALQPDEVVRGQYVGGEIGGEEVAAYLDEPGVTPGSTTESFAALRLSVDNWRWQDVPFFIRAGKRLNRRVTQVSVVFQEPPVSLFSVDADCLMHPNVFEIRLQPSEGFALSFEMKVPGDGYLLQTQQLRFHYDEAFGYLPEAYSTLIADIMSGDQTLFVRADEVAEAWRIVEPVLDLGVRPYPYPAGSWGPAEVSRLIADNGRRWVDPTD